MPEPSVNVCAIEKCAFGYCGAIFRGRVKLRKIYIVDSGRLVKCLLGEDGEQSGNEKTAWIIEDKDKSPFVTPWKRLYKTNRNSNPRKKELLPSIQFLLPHFQNMYNLTGFQRLKLEDKCNFSDIETRSWSWFHKERIIKWRGTRSKEGISWFWPN